MFDLINFDIANKLWKIDQAPVSLLWQANVNVSTMSVDRIVSVVTYQCCHVSVLPYVTIVTCCQCCHCHMSSTPGQHSHITSWNFFLTISFISLSLNLGFLISKPAPHSSTCSKHQIYHKLIEIFSGKKSTSMFGAI